MWQELRGCLVLSERCVISRWRSLRAASMEMLLSSRSDSPERLLLGHLVCHCTQQWK